MIDLPLILDFTCSYYKKDVDLIKSASRKRELVHVRFMYAYLARKYTSCSLISIGNQIGGRDHTTVLNALRCVEDYQFKNRVFKKDLESIEHRFVEHISIDESSMSLIKERLKGFFSIIKVESSVFDYVDTAEDILDLEDMLKEVLNRIQDYGFIYIENKEISILKMITSFTTQYCVYPNIKKVIQ